MGGGEVVLILGLSINANRCGWLFHPSSMQMSIHPALRSVFLLLRHQALSLTMAQPASMKSLTNVGRILLTVVRRAALCVHRGRVPPRQPAPRNGFSLKVQHAEFTLSMSVSPQFEQQQKAQSIPSVMQVKTIKL